MNIDIYIAECYKKSYKWGDFDCFLFAAGAVKAKTGIDHMSDLRGYGDETTAAILLQSRFNTLQLRKAFLDIAQKASAETITKNNAKNGDIVCVRFPQIFNRDSEIDQSCGLGVWYMQKVLACANKGIFEVPSTDRIIDIWRF